MKRKRKKERKKENHPRPIGIPNGRSSAHTELAAGKCRQPSAFPVTHGRTIGVPGDPQEGEVCSAGRRDGRGDGRRRTVSCLLSSEKRTPLGCRLHDGRAREIQHSSRGAPATRCTSSGKCGSNVSAGGWARLLMHHSALIRFLCRSGRPDAAVHGDRHRRPCQCRR